MRRIAFFLLVTTAVLAAPGVAGAARTGVTIHHKNRFHFYGFVLAPSRTDAPRHAP
jgi:hypothetical protein